MMSLKNKTLQEHFGRDSISNPPAITQFPVSIWSDFTDDGAIYHILKLCLEFQKEFRWESIELEAVDRVDDGIELARRLESKLLEVS